MIPQISRRTYDVCYPIIEFPIPEVSLKMYNRVEQLCGSSVFLRFFREISFKKKAKHREENSA